MIRRDDSPVREVKVKAFLFGYDPNVIYAQKGEKIKIMVNNTDFPHGIRIPEFGARGADQVEFVAEKAGEFAWYCNAYCGDGHRKCGVKELSRGCDVLHFC